MAGVAAKWGIGRPKPDAPLQEHVNWYVHQGYRVASQTENSAQLVKPKQFSLIWALLWLLVFGVGILIYVFYYMAKKDKTVYLTVTADSTVQIA